MLIGADAAGARILRAVVADLPSVRVEDEVTSPSPGRRRRRAPAAPVAVAAELVAALDRPGVAAAGPLLLAEDFTVAGPVLAGHPIADAERLDGLPVPVVRCGRRPGGREGDTVLAPARGWSCREACPVDRSGPPAVERRRASSPPAYRSGSARAGPRCAGRSTSPPAPGRSAPGGATATSPVRSARPSTGSASGSPSTTPRPRDAGEPRPRRRGADDPRPATASTRRPQRQPAVGHQPPRRGHGRGGRGVRRGVRRRARPGPPSAPPSGAADRAPAAVHRHHALPPGLAEPDVGAAACCSSATPRRQLRPSVAAAIDDRRSPLTVIGTGWDEWLPAGAVRVAGRPGRQRGPGRALRECRPRCSTTTGTTCARGVRLQPGLRRAGDRGPAALRRRRRRRRRARRRAADVARPTPSFAAPRRRAVRAHYPDAGRRLGPRRPGRRRALLRRAGRHAARHRPPAAFAG